MIGRVYVIKSHQTDKVYIGSTMKTIEQRLRSHKFNYKNYLKGMYAYVSSFEIIQHDDAFIELLEEVNIENKQELHKIEGKYIKKMDCVNHCIAGRSVKEWREDNKEQISEKGKEYRDANKERILEYRKDYYQDNKEQMKEQMKDYYQQNKVQILERMKEIFTCECGSTIAKSSLSNHKRTNKHKKYIDSINEVSKI